MECPYCEASNAPGAIMCISCGRMFDDSRSNLMKLKGSGIYKEDRKMSQQEYMMLHSWEMAQQRMAESYAMRGAALHMAVNATIMAMILFAISLLIVYLIITVNPGSALERQLANLLEWWL